jgi:hypothetical protein
MSLSGQYVEVLSFNGQSLRKEATDLAPEEALLALNCSFEPGNVATRKGMALLWNPNVIVTSMSNMIRSADWLSDGSYLLYFDVTNTKIKAVPNLAIPVPYDVYTQAGAVGACYTGTGYARMAVATYTALQVGAGQARIANFVGYGTPPAIVADKAFSGPLTDKPTLTENAAGSVTAGDHRVGYILETRSGFFGKLCPAVSGGTFDTTSKITSTGGKNVRSALTKTWPAEVVKVWPFMTPTTNLNRYFLVPGLSQVVVGGVSSTATFYIDITDDDLIATGTEVTDNLNLFTQDSGTGPFNPHFVTTFGFRTIYLTEVATVSQGYASEPSNPEHITADQHIFTLPEYRRMLCAHPLGKNLFLFGPHWTYVTEDNGLTPSEWPTPGLVDGAIGTMAIKGVALNASGGFMWVADQAGLYCFAGGDYPKLPVSYEIQPEWNRINWAAPTAIEVVDHPTKQQVFVKAPLKASCVVNTAGTVVTWVSGDYFSTSWTNGTTIVINGSNYTIVACATRTMLTISATAGTQTGVTATVTPTLATHLLMFDYSGGLTSETVKCSSWVIAGYPIGGAAIVQNAATKRLELCVGKAVAGNVLRQMDDSDAAPWADETQNGIDCVYETAPLPGATRAPMGTVYLLPGFQIRTRGSGTLAGTLRSLDRQKTFTLAPITLASLPGTEITRRSDLRAEGASLQLSTNAGGSWFQLSALRAYYVPWVEFR